MEEHFGTIITNSLAGFPFDISDHLAKPRASYTLKPTSGYYAK